MLNARQAVDRAVAFVNEVSLQPPEGLRVEEVLFSKSHNEWEITLGFLGDRLTAQTSSSSPARGFADLMKPPDLATAVHPERQREYRRLCVDAETGEVGSLSIRTLSTG